MMEDIKLGLSQILFLFFPLSNKFSAVGGWTHTKALHSSAIKHIHPHENMVAICYDRITPLLSVRLL